MGISQWDPTLLGTTRHSLSIKHWIVVYRIAGHVARFPYNAVLYIQPKGLLRRWGTEAEARLVVGRLLQVITPYDPSMGMASIQTAVRGKRAGNVPCHTVHR